MVSRSPTRSEFALRDGLIEHWLDDIIIGIAADGGDVPYYDTGAGCGRRDIFFDFPSLAEALEAREAIFATRLPVSVVLSDITEYPPEEDEEDGEDEEGHATWSE